MSNLSDIGFPVQSEQDVNGLIEDLLSVVKPVRCPQGAYYVYADASGAEMYLQGNAGDELVGFNPHYAGKSRRTVCLNAAIERDSSELDGGFHAWANLSDESGASGDYPFVFDAPDFRTYTSERFPRVCDLQLTAFASNDFRVFAGEKDYYDNQDGEVKFAAQSFIPSGLFTSDESAMPIEPPRPIGIFSGVIKAFEVKRNERTKARFYWFLVETVGGEVDVVADPKLILIEPEIGGVVSGQFWLSGRLIEKQEN
ncbi:MAG TPA: hypothetical protein VF692_04330 [Pyrinomonadaceae bacterium]|jgi:hypothetical protein